MTQLHYRTHAGEILSLPLPGSMRHVLDWMPAWMVADCLISGSSQSAKALTAPASARSEARTGAEARQRLLGKDYTDLVVSAPRAAARNGGAA